MFHRSHNGYTLSLLKHRSILWKADILICLSVANAAQHSLERLRWLLPTFGLSIETDRFYDGANPRRRLIGRMRKMELFFLQRNSHFFRIGAAEQTRWHWMSLYFETIPYLGHPLWLSPQRIASQFAGLRKLPLPH